MSKPVSIHFASTRNTPKELRELIKITATDDRIILKSEFCAQESELLEDTLRTALRSIMQFRQLQEDVTARKARR